MIVFGTRRTVTQLAMVVLTCANCHRSAANAVLRAVTKFTLFFIPLFPLRTRYATQCTACGFLLWIDKGQAEQLQQAPPAGSAPPPPLPGQDQAGQHQAGPYGQQPYPQQPYPQQPYPQQRAAPGMPGAAPWAAPHDGGTNGHAARGQ